MQSQNSSFTVEQTRRSWKRILAWFAPPAALILAASGCVAFNLLPSYTNVLRLFLLTLPTESLFLVMPHEPIILYYSKILHPITVAVITLVATLLVEYLNYQVIALLFDLPRIDKLRKQTVVQKTSALFLKAPFASLVIAALTPVPFYPFRVLAPVSKYSLRRYLASIALGRTPRFIAIAYFGRAFSLPNWLILVLFVVMLLSLVLLKIRAGRTGPDEHDPRG